MVRYNDEWLTQEQYARITNDPEANQPQPAQESAAPSLAHDSIRVTASELYAAYYQGNAIAADAKYKGKTLEVSGTVTAVDKDILGIPYLELGVMYIVGVRCNFRSEDESTLAQLHVGQAVTVRGICTGYLVDVTLEDCSLVSSTSTPMSAVDLSKFVSVDLVKAEGGSYLVLTNSSQSLATVSFDIKLYDKDKSYLGGQTWNLQKDSGDKFLPASSTLAKPYGGQNWDSFTISNFHAEELENPFPIGTSTIEVYEGIRFVDDPILGDYETLDSGWDIQPGDDNSYIVGEIENVGDTIPGQILFHTVLRYKGEVVGACEINSPMIPEKPPPGERVKFKISLWHGFSGSGRPVPDLFDSYEVTIISFTRS